MSQKGRLDAAVVIVGNEILTGKVPDLNGPLLIQRLRGHGVSLRSVAVVPDEVDAIVEAVLLARQKAWHVFTSGGIGPTHDDVTVRAVALALGRRVVRLPEMEAMVSKHYGTQTTPEALRLADAPEGAQLWKQSESWYPVLTCDGIYLLPGVPQLFAVQLQTVLGRIEVGQMHLRTLYLSGREAQIAKVLDQVALSMPDVAIGCYPNFDPAAGYAVKLTVEHREQARAEEGLSRLLQALPSGIILKGEF